MTMVLVLTTIDSMQQAQAISNALVARKLAACCQISSIESVYQWEGAIQNDQEFRILVKTTKGRYQDVESVIRDMHTYELPAIYAVDITRAFEAYAEWVEDSTSR